MSDQIHLAEYIVERLKQAGVKSIFGVPGDYNLELLDYFESDPTLQWVGNANELNAAYAADGYARTNHGLGVLVTTFGVGELSALNGIAGCLAERIPVLHIVGAPSTAMQKEHVLLHHTLNTESSFDTFSKMSAPLSCATALLSQVTPEADTSYSDAFDKALAECLTQCRPAYVELPMDTVRSMVSSEGLEKPLVRLRPEYPDPPSHSHPPPRHSVRTPPLNPGSTPTNQLFQSTDDHFDAPPELVTSHVVDVITKKYAAAKRPTVLVDACAARFGVGDLVRELVESCGLRFFTTPMGKGILDERHPLFGGCYAGSNSLATVKDEIEASDFVLYVGALKSDFNSGSFTIGIPTEHAVRLHSFTTNVGFAAYPTTDIRHVLPLLLPAFKKVKSRPAKHDSLEEKIKAGNVMAFKKMPDNEDGKIVHAWLWQRMAAWFKDDDVIITETGTSSFGLLPIPLPSRCTYVTQVLWGSIGWSVGAALGCALAADEQGGRRTVLFVGDGSFQLTVQEVGTIVRRGVPAYIFVLNNDGYEIERLIHGPNAGYNEIQMYNLQMCLPFLGGKKPAVPYESFKVSTQGELHALLQDRAFGVADKVRLIELVMPRGDAPAGLIKQAQLTAKANAK
ncbi:hypothetical protein CcaverHIS631_0406560 [Cutaneotrichosporon cavernicola]|nr:hypothetical protein CcaverHIS631_0406560 [Cutaneotrichosporon cavernicola]